MKRPSDATLGAVLGLIGVAVFSLTLPMTRLALQSFNPVTVSLGRSVIAAFLALPVLLLTRAPRPNRVQLRGLMVVSLGVIVGFPLFSAIAMQYVPASHGAVLNGVLPLMTAVWAAVLLGERPSRAFWLWAVLGSSLVVGFAAWRGIGGDAGIADAAMLVALVLCGLGYAEGGRLSQQLGGWQTICWALVLSFPVLAVAVGISLVVTPPTAIVPAALVGMAYVSFGSMLLGFFAWYSGLALGGVARVGQLQLLQVFMTLGAAAVFFGETVSPASWLFAVGVVGCVAAGRRATVAAPTSAVAVADAVTVAADGAHAEHGEHAHLTPVLEPEPTSGA